jgi:transposase
MRPSPYRRRDLVPAQRSSLCGWAQEGPGAPLVHLPPYSPDLNPIETFFARLKALLRKAAKRTAETPWTEIGDLLNTVTPEESGNCFPSAEYVNT